MFLFLALCLAGSGFSASAWRGRPWRGVAAGPYWSHGYWFHGAYGGRGGWWWIVGPTWYYYPAPLYPYPPMSTEPVYFVQVTGPPPPPNTPGTAQPVLTTGAKGTAMSYYCENSKNYYPVVKTCDGSWIATPVKPPN